MTGCTRASVSDTFDLEQVSNGGHGVSKLGRMGLIFIDDDDGGDDDGEDQWHILL